MGLINKGNQGSSVISQPKYTELVNEKISYFQPTDNDKISPPDLITLPSKSVDFGFPVYFFEGYQYYLKEGTRSFSRMNCYTLEIEVLPQYPFANVITQLSQPLYYGKKIIFMPDDFLTDRLYMFDTETLSWVEDPIILPTNMARISAGVGGDLLYIFGWSNTIVYSSPNTVVTYSYNILTKEWITSGLPLATGTDPRNARGIMNNGKMYITNGSLGPKTIVEFNIEANTISLKFTLPNSLTVNQSVSSFGDKLYYYYNSEICVYSTTNNNLVTCPLGVLIGIYDAFVGINEDGDLVVLSTGTGGTIRIIYNHITNKVKIENLIGSLEAIRSVVQSKGLLHLKTYKGKIYTNYQGTGSNYVYMCSHIYEIDLETQTTKAYQLPDSLAISVGTSFVMGSKLVIFPTSVFKPGTSNIVDGNYTYLFDLETKTFEKLSKAPITINETSPTALSVKGDDLVIIGTNNIRIFNIDKPLYTFSFGVIGTVKLYTEGDKMIAICFSSSAAWYGELDVTERKMTYKSINGTNFTGFTSVIKFAFLRDNYVFVFTAGGYISIFDIQNNIWNMKARYVESANNIEEMTDGRQFKIYSTITNKEVLFDGMKVLLKSEVSGIMKILRGEVLITDNENQTVGVYKSLNNIVEAPILKGYTIKHMSGDNVVIMI